MSAPAIEGPAASGWIISRRADLLWFFASALLSLGLGLSVLARPSLGLPLLCAWLLLVDGPHFYATLLRTYLDPLERQRRGPLLRWSLLIWLPGPLCWAAAQSTGQSAPMDLFLLLTALWGYHHAVRQNYGIWSLYARKAGLGARERGIDRAALYGILWALFAWFTLTHPLNRQEFGLSAEPSGLERPLLGGLLGLILLSITAYGARTALRARRGEPTLPAIFLLFPVLSLFTLGFAAIGMMEPVVPAARTLEAAFVALAITNGMPHGLQYIGLVGWSSRQRHPDGQGSSGARLAARPAWAWLIAVALGLPYLLTNAYRGAIPGWGPGSPAAEGLAISLYWGLVLHHYLLDQYIWRPQQDAALRADLGLPPTAAGGLR